MKPGSKAWNKFMQKIYHWSISIGVLGLTFHYLNLRSEDPSAIIKIATSVMIFVGVIFYCIIWFLSGFVPIQEEPNWELVYPELALGYSDGADLEDFSNELSMEEIQRYNKFRTRIELNVEISKLREELDKLKGKN